MAVRRAPGARGRRRRSRLGSRHSADARTGPHARRHRLARRRARHRRASGSASRAWPTPTPARRRSGSAPCSAPSCSTERRAVEMGAELAMPLRGDRPPLQHQRDPRPDPPLRGSRAHDPPRGEHGGRRPALLHHGVRQGARPAPGRGHPGLPAARRRKASPPDDADSVAARAFRERRLIENPPGADGDRRAARLPRRRLPLGADHLRGARRLDALRRRHQPHRPPGRRRLRARASQAGDRGGQPGRRRHRECPAGRAGPPAAAPPPGTRARARPPAQADALALGARRRRRGRGPLRAGRIGRRRLLHLQSIRSRPGRRHAGRRLLARLRAPRWSWRWSSPRRASTPPARPRRTRRSSGCSTASPRTWPTTEMYLTVFYGVLDPACRPAVVRQRRPSPRLADPAGRTAGAARGHRATARPRRPRQHRAAPGAVADGRGSALPLHRRAARRARRWTARRSARPGCSRASRRRRHLAPEAIVAALIAEVRAFAPHPARRPHAARPPDLTGCRDRSAGSGSTSFAIRASSIASPRRSAPRRPDTVLEIGPGPGGLTEALLAYAGRVVAIEKDRELIAALRARLPAVDGRRGRRARARLAASSAVRARW